MSKFKILILFNILLFSFPHKIVSQNHEWKGKTELKNGVQYIYNPKEGLWDNDQKKELKLVPQFTIGKEEGPKEHLFATVKDITVDDKGNIYVLDKDCVHIYSKSGKHLITFGREGQGGN